MRERLNTFPGDTDSVHHVLNGNLDTATPCSLRHKQQYYLRYPRLPSYTFTIFDFIQKKVKHEYNPSRRSSF